MKDVLANLQEWSSMLTVGGALLTAIATIMLWRVTYILAKETKRMADAMAQPQVVAMIEPSRWSLHYLDLTVSNTGNASAFHIEINFDPPLIRDCELPGMSNVPMGKISILKPSQRLVTGLFGAPGNLNKRYSVDVSWKTNPAATIRQRLVYDLNLAELGGMGSVGPGDPLVAIADEAKKIRERLPR